MGVGKSRSQEIDEEAIAIFKPLLRKSVWQVFESNKDYGIDYKVERIEGGKLTAKTALIQLKGHEQLASSGKGKTSFP